MSENEKADTQKNYRGSVFVIIGMAVAILLLQVFLSTNRSDATAAVRIDDAILKLEESETNIEELSAQLKEDYLQRARVIANMLTLDPDLDKDLETLDKIRTDLGADEYHITDENGVIIASNVDVYIGFDFHSGDQTKPFLQMLTDKNFELAQDPQPNEAEGKLFQYIGVPRQDKSGIVQVGMEPVRLAEALEDSQPNVILKDLKIGTDGTVFTINKDDMTVSAFFDEAMIGVSANEAGFTDKILAKSGSTFKYNGISYRCTFKETDVYYVGALVPTSEITGQVFSLTFMVTLIAIIGIAVLAFIVNRAVGINIVDGVTQIRNTVRRIESGETDLRLNVESCEEFSALSSGINKMLDTLEGKIEDDDANTEKLRRVFSNISSISDGINKYSGEMKGVSKQISEGSVSQAATIEELTSSFNAISDEVSSNASAARNASEAFRETEHRLNTSAEKMEQMQASMQDISTASRKINNIVKTIDDIAFQTNILALNAAVEAARAGQHGKGFAVVADEVRNLANKSAEAVQGTTALVNETIKAVDDGINIANSAAEELKNMLEGVESNTKLIEGISAATEQQAQSIKEVVSGMNLISQVVHTNSSISSDAEKTASMLNSEAEKLMSIMKNA